MAVHDAVYASPPPTWEAFRWRLQHIAEERIGRAIREHGRTEDEVMERLNAG